MHPTSPPNHHFSRWPCSLFNREIATMKKQLSKAWKLESPHLTSRHLCPRILPSLLPVILSFCTTCVPIKDPLYMKSHGLLLTRGHSSTIVSFLLHHQFSLPTSSFYACYYLSKINQRILLLPSQIPFSHNFILVFLLEVVCYPLPQCPLLLWSFADFSLAHQPLHIGVTHSSVHIPLLSLHTLPQWFIQFCDFKYHLDDDDSPIYNSSQALFWIPDTYT